jgi:hypothetical protein
MSDSLSFLKPEAPQASSNAALFVSLYVVLLAFFILLNSISTVDVKRQQEVSESLEQQFSISSEVFGEIIQQAEQKDTPQDQWMRGMEKLFTETWPLQKRSSNPSDGTFYAELNAAQLFAGDTATVRTDTEGTLARLVALMNGSATGIKASVEISISGGVGLLPMQRAGALARALTVRGVPPQQIAIAMHGDVNETVILRFDLRTRPAHGF